MLSLQLFTLWHWILNFLLCKYQMLLLARYLYHVLIISLCLFFVTHTNHNVSHYAFTETYGTEIKVCSWALVTIQKQFYVHKSEKGLMKTPKTDSTFWHSFTFELLHVSSCNRVESTVFHKSPVSEQNTQCMGFDTQNLIPLINNTVIWANISASFPPPTFIL